ncbi:MAG: hypothetical protein IPJ97_14430 [Proteobacteria bacterium]|nr:hypothetical protein [Pseudomonadota bacterium]
MSEPKLTPPGAVWLHQGNLLNPAVRRDIADLNRLFLAHALDPGHGADCWFQLPAATVKRLVEVAPEARERAACSPISLFELALPRDDEAPPWRLETVADTDADFVDRARGETRRSFGLVALSVARRLAENAPFSSRIAFGLGPTSEARLSELTPSDSFRLASWPGLVRPRWPVHSRYLSLLAEAAAGTVQSDLTWAYSAGLCLLGHCERDPIIARCAPARRARPTHRRGPADDTDVPC